jgi:ketosteroid isomerase-like protein
MTREEELTQLNEQYVRASLAGDVEWYREQLSDDFVCVDSDGSVLDKTAFLKMTAQGSELATYNLDEVNIRFYGDVALVRATGSWVAKDGTPGVSKYTDVYALLDGAWRTVSAQITRPA